MAVGSDHVVDTPNGCQIRGRSYPWGVIEVDNEEHCDFVKLRSTGVAQDSSVFREIKLVSFFCSLRKVIDILFKPFGQDPERMHSA